MALLARNVSTNCCSRTASPASPSEPREQGGLGGDDQDEACCRSIADGDQNQAESIAIRGEGTAGFSAADVAGGVCVRGEATACLPPAPGAAVCVQELRWGVGAQLAAALGKFGGFGPDIVLA